uniref:Bestrophin homolog n=1 Tax=Syphacia muris TaxID=451379 RepID=A0A0N5ASV7_9BILA
MTVTYGYDIATATFWRQWRILLYFKGSMWKGVYLEVTAWILIYTTISLVYHTCLNDPQRQTFEKIVSFLDKLNDRIPLTFMLGFYVTNVASRWWTIIMNIGFMDNLIMMANSYMSEVDERSRHIKKTFLRYMCLAQLLVYRKCSTAVAKLYPTVKSIVNAGAVILQINLYFKLLLQQVLHTKSYLEKSESDYISDELFWTPINWAMSVVSEARYHGLILSDKAVQQIYDALTEFNSSQLTLLVYNWIPVPLAYTQVASVTVRCYFLVAVIGRQYVRSRQQIDLYVPFQTIFQLILYIGWLSVAEAMLNPLGDDDDDFDGLWWISRNFSKALEMLSESNTTPPPLQANLEKLKESDSILSINPSTSANSIPPTLPSITGKNI